MTNLELITDALRELGVIDAFRQPTSEDAALALRKLNHLMADLENDGCYVGYFSQTSTSDDLPISDNDAASVLPLLAMSLSINFPSAVITPALPYMAENNRNRLLREAVKSNSQEVSLPGIVPLGSGQTHRSDILNGE